MAPTSQIQHAVDLPIVLNQRPEIAFGSEMPKEAEFRRSKGSYVEKRPIGIGHDRMSVEDCRIGELADGLRSGLAPRPGLINCSSDVRHQFLHRGG
jgi:hypothetical protein